MQGGLSKTRAQVESHSIKSIFSARAIVIYPEKSVVHETARLFVAHILLYWVLKLVRFIGICGEKNLCIFNDG
jgi:hypothetical protein